MGEVDGVEGPGSFNKLNKLVVTSRQPLRPEGTGQGGAKGEWGAVGIEAKDGRGVEGGQRKRRRGEEEETMWE